MAAGAAGPGACAARGARARSAATAVRPRAPSTRARTRLAHHTTQVWKDVDGVLSCDPRLVPDARPVTELTYEEATELAFFGAQVG